MKPRRKWGSVKDTVARMADKTCREIVRETGFSRYSVYYAARRQLIKLPTPGYKRQHSYANV
jgi:hypothetical protein